MGFTVANKLNGGLNERKDVSFSVGVWTSGCAKLKFDFDLSAAVWTADYTTVEFLVSLKD